MIRPYPLDDERINEKMIEYVPELDSEYARTPHLEDEWLQPQDVLGNGSPCFVVHPGDSSQVEEMPFRQDYIWVPGDVNKELLAGYYHLSTREAYCEALRRIVLKDKERKSCHISNALKLKFRSKDEKEEDRVSRKVLQLIKSRLKESSVANSRKTKDRQAQRRRSSLRNSSGTMSSEEFSLMGF